MSVFFKKDGFCEFWGGQPWLGVLKTNTVSFLSVVSIMVYHIFISPEFRLSVSRHHRVRVMFVNVSYVDPPFWSVPLWLRCFETRFLRTIMTVGKEARK